MVNCIHKVVDIRDGKTIEIQPGWDYRGQRGTTLIVQGQKTHHHLSHLNEETIMLQDAKLVDDILHADIVKLNRPI